MRLCALALVVSAAAAFSLRPPRRPGVSVRARPAVTFYEEVSVPAPRPGPPTQEITAVDLTPFLRDAVAASGLVDGAVNVISKHTTTGVTINEWESRLVRDVRAWLRGVAPPDDRSAAGVAGAGVRYLHNDIASRPDSAAERARCRENGWDVDDPAALAAWRAQEPINAHSHLAAMLLGSSETIPVVAGAVVLGQWQSCMLVDLDGPRDRKVGIQALGFGAA